MIISSTTFPHKKIYKGTWKSPDGVTINQIDHVLIQKRFCSCIRDVRSFRGANYDTDHFLVVAKFKLKLQSQKRLESKNNLPYNLERLKDDKIQQEFSVQMREHVENIEEENIEEEWSKISKAITKVAEQVIGRLKSGKKKWYNEKCREAIEKRRMARDNYAKFNDANRKIIYEIERKNCKRIIQREKRNFLNGILQEAEKTVRKVVPANPTVGKIFQRAEPMLNEVTQEESDKAIASLKNWKAPGSDSIPSELIKYGGKQLHCAIFKICQKIWKDERVPTSWNEAIIIPLHKKGDKTICENYRGISLLNSAYKIFSNILLNRLEPYVEENLGEYQCGFRKGRSTIEQLSVIGQIIEKKYEYRQKIWQLFIDFKKAYDSVHR